MRKLKIMEHISLDGVIRQSADENNFPYSDWTVRYRTRAGVFSRGGLMHMTNSSLCCRFFRYAGRLEMNNSARSVT
jgi:hypothetical protein